MKFIINLIDVLKFITRHPLNQNHKFIAVLGFFKWQIGIRLLKKRAIIPWVDDSIFIAGLGETGLTGNIYAGLMEYEDMGFLLHALLPGEIFIDVGANVGAYTILASKVVKSASVAFEPLPNTAQRLRDQIQINDIASSVEIRNIGIGDKQETLFFTNNQDTTNKVSLEGERDGTTLVSVSTLDAELSGLNQYFIKVDVEGFEHNVIEGAFKILSSGNVSALIIELNGSGEFFGYADEDIHQKLLGFGFFPVSYQPKNRTITPLSGLKKNRGNTIYIRNILQMSERCKSAPNRIIHTANNAVI